MAPKHVQDKHRIILYTPFILLYTTLGVYYTIKGIAWGIDAWLSLAFLLVIIALRRWLRLTTISFFLLNAALITHNLGAFGLYGSTLLGLGFDKYQHTLSSAVAAYIVFNFLAYKLHLREHETTKRTVIDDHTTTLTILVIAVALTLGVGIELLEFSGYVLFGQGEGILFVGEGDSLALQGVDSNYADTMTDILANTLGAIIGSLTYYKWRYKRRPWTKT